MNTLWTSARSPFGRRVRIALDERKIQYTEKVIDVFQPPAEFLKIAPLGRVPVWVSAQNEVIADSNAILTGLLAHYPLAETETQDSALGWTGFAVGMMEKTVAYFLAWQSWNSLRAQGAGMPPQIQETFDEYRGIRDLFCQAVENEAAALHQAGRIYLTGTHLVQADIDVTVALAYLTLRDSPEWKERFPNARRYAENLEKRPAFIRTYPPR